jgi:multidrug resistance efflux pump
MMFVRLIALPALSLAGIGLATWTVRTGNVPVAPTPGLVTPHVSPFPARVSATGIVEARSRNLSLGVARSGLVTALPHDIGSLVQQGDLLVQIDDRDAQARLLARKAELASAQQDLARLRSLPRPEEVAPKAAAVAVKQAALKDAESLLALAASVGDPRALSREELTRRQSAVDQAKAAVTEAEAQWKLVQAGAWQADLEVAAAKVAIAQSAVRSAEVDLEQLQVKAPCAGKVLQVNMRTGEYAAAGASAQPVIVLGDVSMLHVRADIDEMDVWRLRPEAQARANLRGNPSLSAPVHFVAIEPLMIPKRSLSGASREQVDTRVLQVLYALDPKDLPVQVGQLVDVSIEATASPDAKPMTPPTAAPTQQGAGK